MSGPNQASSSEQVTLEEMALHLAGGTAVDWSNLCAAFGAPSGWLHEPEARWTAAGLAPSRAARLLTVTGGGAVGREFERCAASGIRLVSHRHAAFPDRLLHLHQPPVLLEIRGRWPPPPAALAVVGARAATPYGRHASALLAGAAARAGHAIGSGLARGIDRFALEAALAERGWAIAVLGCGLDVAYPPENRDLQERIGAEGTLVSEFPLGTRPDTFTFPRRNRIIAAIARQVLVVEAGPRSGALITAKHALDIGREVFAVPGPIDVEASRGCNQLIFDGAVPVLDAALLLFALGSAAGPAAGAPGPPSDLAAGGGARQPSLDERLTAALGGRALGLDELALASGGSVRDVRSALIALELAGMVQRLDGGRWTRRAAATASAGSLASRRD